jgi:glycosyltransferase involved in cell wall biosynthesis
VTSLLASIVIPCYNAEMFIGEAIESALWQSYPHKEVIVIDDGSTDNSLEVIRAFGDLIRWETGPNRGGCVARNRGLELARGEIIQFHDADDVLHPQKLARQIPLMAAGVADIVYSDWFIVPASHPEAGLRSISLLGDPVIFALQKSVQTPAPLHWKERLLTVGGFREGLPCAQEYDLHLRLACAGASFYHLAHCLYTNRRIEGTVSSNPRRMLTQMGEIVLRTFRYLEVNGHMNESRREAFAATLASQGRSCLNHGFKEMAAERFSEAKRCHPSGGLSGAYQPWTLAVRRIIGAEAAERLVNAKRLMCGQARWRP